MCSAPRPPPPAPAWAASVTRGSRVVCCSGPHWGRRGPGGLQGRPAQKAGGGSRGRPPVIALPVPGTVCSSLTWKGCPSLDVPRAGHVFTLRSAGGPRSAALAGISAALPLGTQAGRRVTQGTRLSSAASGPAGGRSRPDLLGLSVCSSPAPHAAHPWAAAPAASAILCH